MKLKWIASLSTFVRKIFFLSFKGLPKGRCSVLFNKGESGEMYFKDGYVHGKVRHFSQEGRLQFVGVYRRGLPHGPVWIFPWSFEEEGAVLVRSGKYYCVGKQYYQPAPKLSLRNCRNKSSRSSSRRAL